MQVAQTEIIATDQTETGFICKLQSEIELKLKQLKKMK
jgi:hypothetical protein